MRDKKHRIINTLMLVAALAFAMLIFNFLSTARSNEVSAVIAFCAGVLIVVVYQLFNYKKLEHKTSKINSMTQIWLGLLLVVSGITVLILNVSFLVEFSTALIWMSGIVLALMFLSIKKFDTYLEKEIK